MNKLILNKEKKELTDSDILKHQDFDSLFRSYVLLKPPFYKKTWFIAGVSVASAAVIALLLYFSVFNHTGNKNFPVIDENTNIYSQNNNALPDKISPPIASLDIKPELFIIDAGRGGNITNKSGSKIHIPAKAFIDQKGKPVKGKVQIHYREFQNPLDIFLSGVPTHYDSAGQTFFMQTAGMMEITAYQDNVELELAKMKKIEVDLTSFFPGRNKIFYFDESKNKWVIKGESELLAEKKNTHAAVADAVNIRPVDTTVVPVLPRKADKKKNPFSIDVDISQIPELAIYKKVSFEVNESCKQIDQQKLIPFCEKASIRPSETPGNYYLTLTIRDSSITYLVYPVFENKNFESALALYNEKRQQRDAELENQKKQNIAHKSPASGNRSQDQTAQAVGGEIRYSQLKPLGERSIIVDKLGMYNCNLPVIAPSDKIQPIFSDINGNAIKNAKLFIADRGDNLLFNFGTCSVISFRKNSSNLLWIVTEDGKIGVLSPESFAEFTNDDDSPEIRLNITDPATGIALLKNYLYI